MQLVQLAEKLVDAVLSDLQRLQEYEQQFFSHAPADPYLELELLQSIWNLYFQWAVEAEEVFRRARSLKSSGIRSAAIAQLDDAIGRVQARLAVKPEQIMKAKEQARQGLFIPAKELRDELNARLRA